MEEERKWEDLDRDLLVEIFGRVGLESLSQCIPFVCKSWYKATLVPKCWKTLVFLHNIHGIFCPRSVKFVKFAVNRSQGTATHVEFLSEHRNQQGLVYISERCSELKSLHLWGYAVDDYASFCDLLCKWKKLEFLDISETFNFIKILETISLHCKNFVGLSFSTSYINEADTAAIVEFLPKIKSLKMRKAKLPRKCLVEILEGCRELEFLDVSNWVGFDAHDIEILELASHIRSFNCDGSVFDDPRIYEGVFYEVDYDGYSSYDE